MEAVILAGGKGTRLKPFTATLPKPLVPVGDRPVIEILLHQCRRAGVARVHLAVNHLAGLIKGVVGDGSRYGLDIVYSVEDHPLSTVGPIKRIAGLPDQFLVANGDVLTDLDMAGLMQVHVESGAELTVAAHQRKEQLDYGVLTVGDKRKVIGFDEKPAQTVLVSMGIYVFSRAVLQHVPDNKPFGFDDLMHQLLRENRPVEAFPYDGYWLDIGRPADYERAQQDVAIFESWLK